MTRPSQTGVSDEFPTDWFEIRKAVDPSTEEGRTALIGLVDRYSSGLKAYLAGRFRFDSHEVDDVFQSFVEQKILKDGLLARADPRRGRFRSFLLNALHRFALSEIRQRNSQKRGMGQQLLNLDDIPDEALPAQTQNQGEATDFIWAQAVIAGALLDMHNELRRTGRTEVWEVFVGRVLQPLLHDEPPLDYGMLIAQYGFKSPTQALNALVTAKRMFRRHLRAVVAQYTGNKAVADEELAHLHWVLNRKGGR